MCHCYRDVYCVPTIIIHVFCSISVSQHWDTTWPSCNTSVRTLRLPISSSGLSSSWMHYNTYLLVYVFQCFSIKGSKKAKFLQFLLVITCSCPVWLWQCAYYAIHVTASQFLDEPCNASVSIKLSCNCRFAAISCYISEWCKLAPKLLWNMKSYVNIKNSAF